MINLSLLSITVDTMDSFLRAYGVYDFIDGSPGVGTLSSIFKPTLPEDADDCGALIVMWIQSGKVLSIRYYNNYPLRGCGT